ncbi:MAG: DUF1579 family protein [Vicinamibacterales bacterium]
MSTSSASLGPHVQAIEAQPVLGPEHRRLDVFIGAWKAEGRTAAGSSGSSENMTQQHTYEWLPGGFHILHRWAGHIGGHQSKGIEVMGYDAGADVYEVHFFDSDGWARIYQARARDRVWTFTGTRERCAIMFADDGRTMTSHWDRSPDGVAWEPLCYVESRRV